MFQGKASVICNHAEVSSILTWSTITVVMLRDTSTVNRDVVGSIPTSAAEGLFKIRQISSMVER